MCQVPAKESNDFLTNQSSIHVLQALRWLIDETFNASPKQFYQVYTIRAWLYDEMHIRAFIFLTNKTQIGMNYELAAQCIRKSCHFHFFQALEKRNR
jgi:hypothetical protein